jgi:predicted SAM-dependent methyltransferase
MKRQIGRLRRVPRKLLRLIQITWLKVGWKFVRLGSSSITKLNLGCGNVHLPNYLNLDIVRTKAVDFVADISDISFLESGLYEEIRLDAVFEHLYRWQQLPFLKSAYKALKPGGKIVLNWLPDFDTLICSYQNKIPGIKSEMFDLYEVYRFTHGDPTPLNGPQQIHKDIFTAQSITKLLQEAGFSDIDVKNVRYEEENVPVNLNIIARRGSGG